jgi:uncharacterized protein (TIGR02569 family)
MLAPPPAAVLQAFGVEAALPLSGGQGTSWRADGLILKPDGGPVVDWLAGVLADVVPDGIRLAAPVPTCDGAWACEGWTATKRVEGSEPDRSQPSTWIRIIEAGRSFHRAVAHLRRPECLDDRQDWWARADRAAWGERSLSLPSEFAGVAARLRRELKPLGRSQVVHGDLTGNVLFAHGLDPAVIDISPYWRPPAYADGVVVADALCWYDASADLLDLAAVSVAAVARALLFRMATTGERLASGVCSVDVEDEAHRYGRAVAALGL